MNETLFRYYLGAFAKENSVCEQCKAVRSIFFSQDLADQEKLDQTIAFFKDEEELEHDTFIFLKRGIRGSYDVDGHVLAVAPGGEAKFWFAIQLLYPNDARLLFAAADANLKSVISDEEIYAPLFIKGMFLKGNVYEIGGEIGAVLLAGKYRFDYQLLFLEQILKEWEQYPKDAQEEINELLAEYAFDGEKIKFIQLIIEKYKPV